MSDASFVPSSDRSLLVRFGEEEPLEAHHRVAGLERALRAAALGGVVDLHPGYASLLVVFDPLATGHGAVAGAIRPMLALGGAEPPSPRTVEIPVAYGGTAGPDLPDVAAHAGLSPQEVVSRHAGATYRVFFLGFSPGFAYLGGLPGELATPRLPRPRTRVPAGSVGIAGTQTGVYPLATPGGWRLIGRTPLRLFCPGSGETLLATGDLVRFRPVGEEALARAAEAA